MSFSDILNKKNTINVYEHQLELWRSYFNKYDLEINKKFCNPCREDRNPGAILKYIKNHIRLFDTPYIHHGKTIFDIIIEENHLSNFKEMVEHIKNNHRLFTKDVRNITKRSSSKSFRIFPDKWCDEDYAFWCDSTPLNLEDVEKYQCHPLKALHVEREGYMVNKFIPCRAYVNFLSTKYFKAYGPKERFFYTNLYQTPYAGENHNTSENDTLLVGKNFKSHAIAKKLNITDSVYMSCEGVIKNISTETINKWLSKYKKVFGLFDPDAAGKKAVEDFEQLHPTFKATCLPIDDTYLDTYENKKPVADLYDLAKAGYPITDILKYLIE